MPLLVNVPLVGVNGPVQLEAAATFEVVDEGQAITGAGCAATIATAIARTETPPEIAPTNLRPPCAGRSPFKIILPPIILFAIHVEPAENQSGHPNLIFETY